MNFHKLKEPTLSSTLFIRTDPDVKQTIESLAKDTGGSLNKTVNEIIMYGLKYVCNEWDEQEEIKE